MREWRTGEYKRRQDCDVEGAVRQEKNDVRWKAGKTRGDGKLKRQ